MRFTAHGRKTYELDGQTHPGIYLMRYEDMLGSPARTFRGLVDHLLISATDEEIDRTLPSVIFRKRKGTGSGARLS